MYDRFKLLFFVFAMHRLYGGEVARENKRLREPNYVFIHLSNISEDHNGNARWAQVYFRVIGCFPIPQNLFFHSFSFPQPLVPVHFSSISLPCPLLFPFFLFTAIFAQIIIY